MWKKLALYSITILLVTAAILLDAAAIFYAVTSFAPAAVQDEDEKRFSSWQKDLTGDTLVTEVVLPGAHDAGTNGMSSIMETQGSKLDKQLRFGCRYFDVRPMLWQGKVYPYHALPNLFYPFETLLNDVVTFLNEKTTEFVILDFQHFASAEEAVKTMLDAIPEVAEFSVPNSVDIASLTVGEMRANGYRMIIVWNEGYSPADRPYLHGRSDTLYSPYREDAHKESDESLLNEFDRYYNQKPDGIFFVLQAQRTGTFGKEMQINLLEQSFRPKVNKMLRELPEDKLNKTNIVMRDYITNDAETMELILNLNYKKGFLSRPV